MNSTESLIKKLIIIIVVLIIFIICIISFFRKSNNQKNDNEIISDSELPESVFSVENSYQKLKSLNTYLSVKKCVDMYYSKYSSCFISVEQYIENYDMKYNENSDNGEAVNIVREKSRQEYIELIEDTYIKDKDIKTSNFENKINKISKVKPTIINIYEQQKNNNVSAFFINGYIREDESNNILNFNIVVMVDKKNNAFKIYPQEYYEEKEFNKLNIGDKADIYIPEEIKLNENGKNKYQYQNYSDEYIAKMLIERYKEEILYNPQIVFNDLDREYRKKRFNSYDEFLKYVEEKKDDYKKISTKKYLKNSYDNYNQFVCLDADENYYIFNQNKDDSTDFSIILDTYTVDIPQFVEKYNNVKKEEKVALNMNRFISAINDKNYTYAYSVLAESFKKNKFSNEEDFIQCINNQLYEKNEIKSINCEKKDEYYVATMIIESSEKEEKEFKAIVKLDEGTKFEMSFEIK